MQIFDSLDFVLLKFNSIKPSCLGSSGKELLPRTYPENTGFDSQGEQPLMGRKPVQKPKKKLIQLTLLNLFIIIYDNIIL